MAVPPIFRKTIVLLFPLFTALGMWYVIAGRDDGASGSSPQIREKSAAEFLAVWREDEERAAEAAAGRDHDPWGRPNTLERVSSEYSDGMNAFLGTPSEPAVGPSASSPWIFKGPAGANYRGTKTDYCGRVRDLEIENVPSLRVASGTGGLFKTEFLFPVPMSDDVDCRNTGAFATSPVDPTLVLLGTGEPPMFPGLGLWRTTDEGKNWNKVPGLASPSIFYKIAFQPGSGSVVHAACNTGLFLSLDSGKTWDRKVFGEVTGFDIVPTAPNILYAASRGQGVYKSTNFGVTYAKLNAFPAKDSLFWTASIAIAKSNINIVYVNVVNKAHHTTGLFRTSDGGQTWEDRSYRDSTGAVKDIHWGQGNRNNCIGVSPTNADLLLVGGGGLIRSSDGGLTWTEPPAPHPDHCVIKWKSDGKTVYDGNDGGIALSTDGGITWGTTGSVFPIMEFWSIEAAGSPTGMVFVGGTQDNAVVNTSNGGSRWFYNLGADGGAVTLDKNAPGTQIAKQFSGPDGYLLWRTTDYGMSWTRCGLETDRPGGIVLTDRIAPTKFYYLHANTVSVSTDAGASWSQLGDTLPGRLAATISVARRSASIAPVFVVTSDTLNKILLYDGKGWTARNAGLPRAYFKDIAQHPTNNAIAYAFTSYIAYPGQKIYKTTNQGQTWNNNTGDFPNLPLTGMVIHPTNPKILFASTTWYGVLKSTDGGATWFRWMNGMPKTLWVEALAYIDSTAINGKFYVVAGSQGRGVWVREGSSMEIPTAVAATEQPSRFILEQNYPNPFNPATSITFDLPVRDHLTLEVFDINGRLVREVLQGQELPAGSHTVRFDGRGLASGTYFYRLSSSRQTSVKKMLLLR